MAELLDVGEAWGRIAAAVCALEAQDEPLAEAVGRVLAQDVRAPLDLPGFDDCRTS